MRLKLPDSLQPASREPQIVLLPADRFFMRVAPLAPDGDITAQVELALEGLSPFAIPQLYYGYLLAPDRASALVFAAYRRRFTTDETEKWDEAEAVLPAFAALLAEPPKFATALLHADGPRLTGLAWDGHNLLPGAVHARELDPGAGAEEPVSATPEQRDAFAAELRGRVSPAPDAVRWLEGPPAITFGERDGTFMLTTPGQGGEAPLTVTLDAAQLATMDVRDKGVLAARRRDQARDLLLWRVFVGCALGVAAAVVLEIGLGLWGYGLGPLWLKQRQATVQKQAPIVKKIETAQTLALRVEDLSTKRLTPLHMLGFVCTKKPGSIRILQSSTKETFTIEVQAETSNAADVGAFESALNEARDSCEKAVARIGNSRGGVTSFGLTVKFKPDWFRKIGGGA